MPLQPPPPRCLPARHCLTRCVHLLLLTGLISLLGLSGALTHPARASSTDPVGAWPLPPPHEVVTGFDPPTSPWGAGHRGVDLLGRTGAQVRAALPGQVSFAGRIAGRGVVVVDHGGTRTTYQPVLASLEVGAVVRTGEVIGTLDLIGSHCFPRACLHWGWLRGATYLDPLRLVGAGPVRLLPLGAGPWVAPMTTATGSGIRPWGAPVRRPAVAGPW